MYLQVSVPLHWGYYQSPVWLVIGERQLGEHSTLLCTPVPFLGSEIRCLSLKTVESEQDGECHIIRPDKQAQWKGTVTTYKPCFNKYMKTVYEYI